MTADPLMALARHAGVVASFTTVTGERKRTGRGSAAALLAAMGLPATAAEAADWLAQADAARSALPSWVISTPGAVPDLGLEPRAEWRLQLESGAQAEGRGPALPPLPLGLHSLQVGNDHTTLIVAPHSLPLPEWDWGVMVPLHALRPAARGGIGDYADLAQAGTALARAGAAFLGLNPIHAGFTADPSGFSPYTPSHRRRLSILHVATGEAPTPSADLIDYSSAIPDRMAALRRVFAAFDGDPDFDRFCHDGGQALLRFATHQALSDRHGAYWNAWPAALRDPNSTATRAAAAELAGEITFYRWAQWQADAQLRAANGAMRQAGMRQGLYLDLAVGTHPHGAETWEDRTSFATGASLGAPPDAFSADGQSWGLAPFNPRGLVAQGFAPLAETLRTQLRLCGVLRIDHILGFDRAFWVPENGAPGAYVQMPRAAMLAIVRLEAARANAIVVGEDLGNVPRGLRKTLAQNGILGSRVMMFERDGTGFRAPRAYPVASMASFSTHDLPTWKGWRAGADIAARAALNHIDAAQAQAAHQDRQQEVGAFDSLTADWRGAEPATSVAAMHATLGATGSTLALLQIECLLDRLDQPNLPGTTTQYPNWRQRLPVDAGSLDQQAGVQEAAALMRAAGRGRQT